MQLGGAHGLARPAHYYIKEVAGTCDSRAPLIHAQALPMPPRQEQPLTDDDWRRGYLAVVLRGAHSSTAAQRAASCPTKAVELWLQPEGVAAPSGSGG
jgi:hypothetical protein